MNPDELTARLLSPDYRSWRAQVEASGGCSAPVHLHGSSRILDRDGAVLVEREGTVLGPCGNRRETVCPACSDRYATDAYHLLRAGLAGDEGKGVPATVTEHPRAFLTLTAPSFGRVHTRKVTPRGLVLRCGCGERHHGDDPRVSTPIDPQSYDYDGAVLWQAHAGMLWARFTTALRRALAAALGVPVRAFPDHARLSYAKVAEYQRRGLVHFHAVVRLDGPAGPADPPPAGLTPDALHAAVLSAARSAHLDATRPDGVNLELRWGTQVDLRPVTAAAAAQLEDEHGHITDAALAGYIAKYATKGTGASDTTADRPVRDGDHIAYLDVSPHHKAMIATAWRLGGREQYAALNLRRWAHMLGFRGHFLTKSRAYSVTFGAIRAERRTFHLRATLDELTDPDDPDPHPVDLDTVTVVNDWTVVRFGHRTPVERELAEAIAARNRNRRRSRFVTSEVAA